MISYYLAIKEGDHRLRANEELKLTADVLVIGGGPAGACEGGFQAKD